MMGKTIYDLTVVGTFFLGYSLWNRKVWVAHPAFAAYILFCGIRSLVLHPALRTIHYGEHFWYWQFAALPFIGAAVGEVYGQKIIGAIMGACASAAACIFMLNATALTALGNKPDAMLNGLLCIDVVRYAGIGMALIALCGVRSISGIASGLTVSLLFSSLAIGATGDMRYAAAAAWVVALFLWLDWVRTYRAESRATTYRPSLRPSPLRRGVGISGIQRPCSRFLPHSAARVSP